MRLISASELEKHNKEGDVWVAINGKVHDLSAFARFHPGGKQILIEHGGRDVTEIFNLYHGPTVMRKYKDKFVIGELEGYEAREPFVPLYGDPIWTQRFNSPYYKESHAQFRLYVRKFVTEEILPTIDEWKDKATPPLDVCAKMGDAGIMAGMAGGAYPFEYVTAAAAANIPRDWDYFHELIIYDEISRIGFSAVIAALTNGPAIALSAVLAFGSDELKKRIAPDVLMGRKFIALAISEVDAGSDVNNLKTVARADGTNFILNGSKKWITNGTYADYFVVACKTGSTGHKGMSMFLLEKNTPGFTVRKINIRGSDISGTSYLLFENVEVPAANLIGRENDGWKQIMFNFNHERMYIVACCVRLSRVCLEESIIYASSRKTFGKYLREHQEIRLKIARMACAIEMLQTWLDAVVYQMTTMSHAEANLKIGDVMCLLKAQASRVYELCARETTNIFGGNALHVDGRGGIIEPAQGQLKGYMIPAGSEDVMMDFGARTIFKHYQHMSKL